MDEPFCRVRQRLKKSDAYAVGETAKFVALVRKNYPSVRIGDSGSASPTEQEAGGAINNEN